MAQQYSLQSKFGRESEFQNNMCLKKKEKGEELKDFDGWLFNMFGTPDSPSTLKKRAIGYEHAQD
ncbi:hypothetical protein A0J61_08214 [Choanephora cucurbitarum]|uniref:Uncharacterized protein n=1 Tax=Choanephora cucurbitarum TaxID=101091 RepID=A0A1C7N510_9FUNG|nr:hypothetical protein A0J61_08214 [Choanephora cucurbitarum]